jgi:hypothetical protein
MDIALVGLDSSLVYLLPLISLLFFIRPKYTFENYSSIIGAINLGFAGWTLGHLIHFGHWCIPCLLSSIFALLGFSLSKYLPKFGGLLLSFSFPFFFYPMLWSVFPGIPEADLLLIIALLGLILAMRSLKWKNNYSSSMIKAYSCAFLMQSCILVLSKLAIIDKDSIVSNNDTYQFVWLIVFLVLYASSTLFSKFLKPETDTEPLQPNQQ